MTTDIKSLIEQIGAKSKLLHQSLVIERERNSSIEVEMNRLRVENSELKNTQDTLNQEVQGLKLELSQRNNEKNILSESTVDDSKIDLLVREIDFCIQQLKIANE